jgi:gag-polypeptide of LTR copia-type
MREELSAMGTQVTEEEYAYILLRSLPKSYAGIINSLAAQADLNSQTITPSNIIYLAMDEYARHAMEKKNKGTNKAFAATPWKAANEQKKQDVKCFNCHKCRHIKVDCWASGSRKEGQGP